MTVPVLSEVPPSISAMDQALPAWLDNAPATWSAWFAGIALAATIFGATLAYRQLKLARETQTKQAQPSVVMFSVHSVATFRVIDLVVKNFGNTPAYNVRISANPPILRTRHDGETDNMHPLWLPDVIPTLAPGQEWRTTWDFTPKRYAFPDSKDYDRSAVTVTFEDREGEHLSTRSVLDLAAYRGRGIVPVHTVHDVAEALSTLASHVGTFREGHGNGLLVWSRDGDAKDQRDAAQDEQRRRDHDAYMAAMTTPESKPDAATSKGESADPPPDFDATL